MYFLVKIKDKDRLLTGFDLQGPIYRDVVIKGTIRKSYPSLDVLKVSKKNPTDFIEYLEEKIKEITKRRDILTVQLENFRAELEDIDG